MEKDKERAVINALADFIIRVAKGDATPEEINILPAIAKILLD